MSLVDLIAVQMVNHLPARTVLSKLQFEDRYFPVAITGLKTDKTSGRSRLTMHIDRGPKILHNVKVRVARTYMTPGKNL